MQKRGEPAAGVSIWLVLATVLVLVYVVWRGMDDGWDILRVAMLVVFSLMLVWAAGSFIMARRR